MFSSRLIKILVRNNTFTEIISKLDTLEVNQITLFPDLEGVSKYSVWLHTVLDDEPADTE